MKMEMEDETLLFSGSVLLGDQVIDKEINLDLDNANFILSVYWVFRWLRYDFNLFIY